MNEWYFVQDQKLYVIRTLGTCVYMKQHIVYVSSVYFTHDIRSE